MLREIQHYFSLDRILYTRHARDEMEAEEFGQIKEHEVYEAISEVWEEFERRKR